MSLNALKFEENQLSEKRRDEILNLVLTVNNSADLKPKMLWSELPLLDQKMNMEEYVLLVKEALGVDVGKVLREKYVRKLWENPLGELYYLERYKPGTVVYPLIWPFTDMGKVMDKYEIGEKLILKELNSEAWDFENPTDPLVSKVRGMTAWPSFAHCYMPNEVLESGFVVPDRTGNDLMDRLNLAKMVRESWLKLLGKIGEVR